MVWFFMLIKLWVIVVLDFICLIVFVFILKKNVEFLYFMVRKVLLIKILNI